MFKKLVSLWVAVLVVSLSAAAFAETPNLELSTVAMPNAPGGEQLFIYNLPDASGAMFTEAIDTNGDVQDGTVVVTILNDAGMPIADYPLEDLWIEPVNPDKSPVLTFYPCVEDGLNPEANTNPAGQASWVSPLNAGGYTDPTQSVTQVYVAGLPLQGPGVDLQHKSADLNHDGIVNLVDVGDFAAAFFNGVYDWIADFDGDGNENLVDVGLLASALPSACP